MTTHICEFNPSDGEPESARALLWRHGLPEDIVDGALALFAQELAGKIRAHRDHTRGAVQATKVMDFAADLISPENWARTEPVPAGRDALRDRIAAKKAEPAFQKLAEAWSQPVSIDAVYAVAMAEAADECDKAGAAYAGRALNDHAAGAFALMETFLRKANEAEYVATPCDFVACEPGGEPCSVHERLMAHAEGDHELCQPDCDPRRMIEELPVTAEEAYRLALSTALRLGTGANWEAIRDRAEDLVAEVRQLTEASRRLLEQRQEMAAERFAWQERGDRAEARVRQMEAAPPADRAAVLREAADGLDAAMDRFFAEWPDEPRNSPYALGQKDAAAELRRLAVEERDEREVQAHLDQLADELPSMDGEAPHPDPCRNCRGSGLDPRYNGEYACPDCPAGVDAQPAETPCGPAPDQCDAEAGDPCASHEREQAHAEGEHCFCGPECDKACT